MNRTLCALEFDGTFTLNPLIAHFWTPHSGRAFLPTCTAILGYDKSTRDFLGGWNAQGSDRYTRAARTRIFDMQLAVVKALAISGDMDVIGESETAAEFSDYLSSLPLAEDLKLAVLRGLEKRPKIQEPQGIVAAVPSEVDPQIVPYVEEEPHSFSLLPEQKKRRGGHALVRTEELGCDPRARREAIRATMQPGFYLCYSGKRSVRTLHKLGACYALPGIDYVKFEYLGTDFPSGSFDVICKLCARKEVGKQVDDSDHAFTSSSTDECEA